MKEYFPARRFINEEATSEWLAMFCRDLPTDMPYAREWKQLARKARDTAIYLARNGGPGDAAMQLQQDLTCLAVAYISLLRYMAARDRVLQ